MLCPILKVWEVKYIRVISYDNVNIVFLNSFNEGFNHFLFRVNLFYKVHFRVMLKLITFSGNDFSNSYIAVDSNHDYFILIRIRHSMRVSNFQVKAHHPELLEISVCSFRSFIQFKDFKGIIITVYGFK